MRITTEIVGDKKVLEMLKRFGEEGRKATEDVVYDTGYSIQLDAKTTARNKKIFDQGGLVQGITLEPKDKLNYRIVSNATYSGYIEFGTGPKVQVPPEFKSYAQSLKGRNGGTFKEGLRYMADWCRRHGFDESLAWVFLVNLLRKGRHPRPFMYPAFIRGKRTFEANMKKAIKELTEKYK